MSNNLLFIPVYNCEKQIIRVLEKINKSEIYDKFNKILIIDNRSKDETINVAKNFIKINNLDKCILLLNENNVNLGGSHKVGFNYAVDNNYDYVAILHGDDQGDIKDFKSVFENNKYEKYDCSLGARFHKKSNLINYSKFRIYCNILINTVASIVTRRFLKDLGAGLNMYKVNFLKNKFYLNFPNDLTFNYYLMFYICYMKANFFYFPLTWKEEDQVSNVRLFEFAIKWSIILFKFIFNKKKLFNNNEYKSIEYKFEII